RFPGIVAAPPGRVALYDPLTFVFVEILPGDIEADAGTRRVLLHLDLAFLVRRRLPGLDGAFPQGLALVGNHEGVVDAHDPTKATAVFAGAQRGDERKGAVQRRAVFDVALRAVQTVAVAPGSIGAVVGDGVNGDVAVALLERRVERLHDTLGLCVAVAETVLGDMQDTPRCDSACLGPPAFAGAF